MALKADHDVMSIITALIQTCRDREAGYRVARQGVSDPALKRLFNSYADQSAEFRQTMEQALRQRGGDIPEGGGDGTAIRGLTRISAAVARGDETMILAECEHGEDVAVADYRRALEAGLPPEWDTVIGHQASQIEEAHTRIRTLRDVAKTSPSE